MFWLLVWFYGFGFDCVFVVDGCVDLGCVLVEWYVVGEFWGWILVMFVVGSGVLGCGVIVFVIIIFWVWVEVLI